MSEPIKDCPQPETPIRERAYAPAQIEAATTAEADAAIRSIRSDKIRSLISTEDMKRALADYASLHARQVPDDHADAERYRWLRSVGEIGCRINDVLWETDKELDDAIDAMIASPPAPSDEVK